MRALLLSISLILALAGLSAADPTTELSAPSAQEQAFARSLTQRVGTRVNHILRSFRSPISSVQRTSSPSMIQGEGVRVALGRNSVERLQFASPEEAQTYAFENLGLVRGQPADPRLSVDLRGDTLLVVQGPIAVNPQTLEQIRGAAFPEGGEPDLLATTDQGMVVLQSRLENEQLQAALDETRQTLSQMPEAKRPAPGLLVGEHSTGSRTEIQEGPDGFRALTFSDEEHRGLAQQLAGTYQESMGEGSGRGARGSRRGTKPGKPLATKPTQEAQSNAKPKPTGRKPNPRKKRRALVKPTKPQTVKPTKPGTKPTKPQTVKPTKPGTKPSKPQTVKPIIKPTKPGQSSDKPKPTSAGDKPTKPTKPDCTKGCRKPDCDKGPQKPAPRKKRSGLAEQLRLGE